MRLTKTWGAVGTLSLALGSVGTAWAGGLELPDNGSLSMGRGGAFVARASDPSALMINTAGIVGLPGFQATISSNFGFFNHCFQREGNYDQNIDVAGTVFDDPVNLNTYNNTSVRYPQVCRNQQVTLAPQILMTYRPIEQLAFGLGVYGPNSAGSTQTFPETVANVMGANGMRYLVPSPVRYALYDKSLLLFHITAAVAYAPVPWLRFGAAIQPTYATFRFGTFINSNPAQPESPNADLHLNLNASGWSIAGNFGVQVAPLPYLQIGAHIHLNYELNLAGNADVVYNYFAADASTKRTSVINLNRMNIVLPWNFRIGARFALPRPGRPRMGPAMFNPQQDQPMEMAPAAPPPPQPATQTAQNGTPTGTDPTGTATTPTPAGAATPATPRPGPGPRRPAYDPMTDEFFDIEVDFIYESTSSMSSIVLETSGQIDVGGAFVSAPGRSVTNNPSRDMFGVRVGGDINIVPGIFTLRTGFSWDNGATTTSGVSVTLPSYETFSIHAGASVRLRWFTINIAYGHYFFTPLNSTDGMARVLVSPAPSNYCMGMGALPQYCTINRGTYNAGLDILNVGLNFAYY